MECVRVIAERQREIDFRLVDSTRGTAVLPVSLSFLSRENPNGPVAYLSLALLFLCSAWFRVQECKRTRMCYKQREISSAFVPMVDLGSIHGDGQGEGGAEHRAAQQLRSDFFLSHNNHF
ncbi:hypothetical protein GOP47_0008309 [Adiantum capillus-veneris]|uniref:Transmembrane protein n=1 Tax=Adiantum capillus-veneris TaxID=13818 RepID=A0A9D4UYG7_ADICA|nr:hypothetical protein GOP47_0008309 [Adiantum capillus-veneris]